MKKICHLTYAVTTTLFNFCVILPFEWVTWGSFRTLISFSREQYFYILLLFHSYCSITATNAISLTTKKQPKRRWKWYECWCCYTQQQWSKNNLFCLKVVFSRLLAIRWNSSDILFLDLHHLLQPCKQVEPNAT